MPRGEVVSVVPAVGAAMPIPGTDTDMQMHVLTADAVANTGSQYLALQLSRPDGAAITDHTVNINAGSILSISNRAFVLAADLIFTTGNQERVNQELRCFYLGTTGYWCTDLEWRVEDALPRITSRNPYNDIRWMEAWTQLPGDNVQSWAWALRGTQLNVPTRELADYPQDLFTGVGSFTGRRVNGTARTYKNFQSPSTPFAGYALNHVGLPGNRWLHGFEIDQSGYRQVAEFDSGLTFDVAQGLEVTLTDSPRGYQLWGQFVGETTSENLVEDAQGGVAVGASQETRFVIPVEHEVPVGAVLRTQRNEDFRVNGVDIEIGKRTRVLTCSRLLLESA